MPEPNRKLRVFLCHTSQDKPIVRELYQRLLAEGWIDPWLDEEKLLPGQDWGMEIEKVVETVDAVIVCLSSRFVNKEGYVQKELKRILDKALEKPENQIFLIPIRLDNCILPQSMKDKHYVDFYPPELREKKYQLLIKSFEHRLNAIRERSLDMEIPSADVSVPLSDLIITRKYSDARLALQNGDLEKAAENYQILIEQGQRLNEIIGDLEDVLGVSDGKGIYKNNRVAELLLAAAYHARGEHKRARELQKKYIHFIGRDDLADE